MACLADARHSVDIYTYIALARTNGLAGVQPHPNPKCRALRPPVIRKYPLRRDGRLDGVSGSFEDKEEALSLILVDAAAYGINGITEQPSMVGVVIPPYRFFYRVERQTVWVVAVWHSAQLPDTP